MAEKIAAARRHRLTPMVCVGETRGERRAGWTFEVLARQLGAALAALTPPVEGSATAAEPDFVVAYEPVWAIGSGETATPETAQEAHRYLRDRLAEGATGGWGRGWGERVRDPLRRLGQARHRRGADRPARRRRLPGRRRQP